MIDKHDGPQGKKIAVTGIVEKIILATPSSSTEKAQISVAEGEDLYREIRLGECKCNR